MAGLKEKVGETAGPFEETVERGQLEAFARAVGVELESGAEWDSVPTYPTLFRRGEFELFTALGIPLHRVLHAEQEYDYHRSVEPATDVRYETRLAKASTKEGSSGVLNFLTFETEVRGKAEGNPFVTTRTTIVVKGEL